MCGICGDVRFDGGPVTTEDVIAMRDRLIHRGPDAAGLYVAPHATAGLGFRRLKIVDLSDSANQPLPNEDGSVQLVFNGEIYNFADLRADLLQRGHRFRSRSDSEVIVHLYEEYGPACIDKLNGMFAIAIWDDRRRQLVLARDRAGKKPLFYRHAGNRLVFASEIKAFFARPDLDMTIDPEAIPYYFLYGYVPSPGTFYRGVRQVDPGTVITIDRTGQLTSRVFWRLEFTARAMGSRHQLDRVAAVSKVRELLTMAVERRLVSDVPLGAFLSGGIDSTIVVGLMSRLMREPVKTFSIGFEGDARYDETSYARIVADRFATDHTEFRVSPSAVDLLDRLIWHHDGPFGDASAVPTYIVAELTRRHVTVVLNGDGGDELFAGYRRFSASVAAERIPAWGRRGIRALLSGVPGRPRERDWLAQARRFASAMSLPLAERITRWTSLFDDDLEELVDPSLMPFGFDRLDYLNGEQPQLRGLSALSQVLYINFRTYLLNDLLVKMDRCTMANSLEARSPFLDTALTEYVARLPDRFKLRGHQTKVILREAFADLLPAVVAQRGKMGFGVPLGTWFRRELREYLIDHLLDPSARYRTYLSATVVHRLIEDHLAGRTDAGLKLWALLCFERWLRVLPEWTRRPDSRPERPTRPAGRLAP